METASRWIGVAGVVGLAALGITYWLTYEPAPRVRVLWRGDVVGERRAALERRYLLVNPRDRLPSGSLAYDLLDTSTSNIRAIVNDPAIVDTNDIERHTFVVPFDVEYGREWMWQAHRTPGLQNEPVRTALILVLAAMAIGGLAPDGVRLWRTVSARPARRSTEGRAP